MAASRGQGLAATLRHAAYDPLLRRDDIAALTFAYRLIVADECHHVLAAAF